MQVWLISETKTKDNQKTIHKEWYILHPVVVHIYDFVNDAFLKFNQISQKLTFLKIFSRMENIQQGFEHEQGHFLSLITFG